MISDLNNISDDEEKDAITTALETLVLTTISKTDEGAQQFFSNAHHFYNTVSSKDFVNHLSEVRKSFLTRPDPPPQPDSIKHNNKSADKNSKESEENSKQNNKVGRRKKIELSLEKIQEINKTLIGQFNLTLDMLSFKIFQKKRGKKKEPQNIITEHTTIKNERFNHGDNCPKCNKGRLYVINNGQKDSVLKKIKERFIRSFRILETLRCNGCDYRNAANVPTVPGEHNGFSAEVRADFAVDTADGIPCARQEKRSQDAGVDISRKDINLSNQEFGQMLQGVVNCMDQEISNSASISADGTSFKVLEATQKELDPNYVPGTKKDPNDRASSRATSIVGKDAAQNTVAIRFHIDQMHPGEHVEALLTNRTIEEKPIFMADMLTGEVDAPSYKKTANTPSEPYYRAGCLDHLMVRLKKAFKDFPAAEFFIEKLETVYYFDALTKANNFSVQDRFEFHKKNSLPIMQNMFQRATELLPDEEKQKRSKKDSFNSPLPSPLSTSSNPKVEPNSKFGTELKYFKKNFLAFTQFCKRPGVPLSNIHCEHANKRIIIFRKNSYIFRTLESAKAHANLFSVTATARELGLNVADYLLILLQNETDLRKNPHLWTPLAYLKRLEQQADPPAIKLNSLYKPFRPVEKTA